RALPRLGQDQLDALFVAATAHGVLPATLRGAKLHLTATQDGLQVPARESRELAATFAEAEQKLHLIVGQSLRLHGHYEKAMAALAAAGIDAAAVKGPVYAARLYPRRSDRSFTDIDILIAPSAVEAAGEAMRDLGFEPLQIEGRDSDLYGEHKWVLPGDTSVMIELHEGLVHSPSMRRTLFLDLAECRMAGGGDASDATALLLVAAVHAAAGDHFNRLQPLVDVLQAVRGREGPVDATRLVESGHRTGCLRAVALALRVAGRIFSEEKCLALSEKLMPGANRLEGLLVAPSVVLTAQSATGRRVSWRRKIARQLIRRPVRGTAEGKAAS
ncbi:MAG TPA: nucleotidyltransferase family protein, partial [Hyphomicrobiales bacterium]|nr:nucleotidyltransferase family protein [Hyphomicrobiales bacterium]